MEYETGTVQYSIAQHSTVQCIMVQHRTVQSSFNVYFFNLSITYPHYQLGVSCSMSHYCVLPSYPAIIFVLGDFFFFFWGGGGGCGNDYEKLWMWFFLLLLLEQR